MIMIDGRESKRVIAFNHAINCRSDSLGTSCCKPVVVRSTFPHSETSLQNREEKRKMPEGG